MLRTLLSSKTNLVIKSLTSKSLSPSILNLNRQLSTEARLKIDEAVKATPLVLFMKGTPDMPQCGFSRAVCQILEVQGVKPDKFKAFNCLEDPELREGIKEYSSWPTIPQLYIGGEFVGGCDIVLQMHQSGELEKALVDAGVSDAIPAASETPVA